jgi:hypothetical protein
MQAPKPRTASGVGRGCHCHRSSPGPLRIVYSAAKLSSPFLLEWPLSAGRLLADRLSTVYDVVKRTSTTL